MQREAGSHLRHALARHIGVRIKAHRIAAVIGDAVGDGEHVFVVDGDGAVKVRPGRCPRSGLPACPAPGCRRRSVSALWSSSTFTPGRSSQRRRNRDSRCSWARTCDLRTVPVGGLAVFLQAQIVELGARQVRWSRHHRCRWRRAPPAFSAASREGARCRRRRHAGHAGRRGGAPACTGLPMRLLLMGELGLARLLGLHRRGGDEILPGKQHPAPPAKARNHVVSLVVHGI